MALAANYYSPVLYNTPIYNVNKQEPKKNILSSPKSHSPQEPNTTKMVIDMKRGSLLDLKTIKK